MTNQNMTALSQLFTRELEVAADLLKALEQERKALTREDSEGIETAVTYKLQVMEQLRERLQMRDDFLLSQGFPKGKRGTEAMLNEAEAHDEQAAMNLWQRLQILGDQLRDENEINGTMVTMAHRQARQALEILTGRSAQQQTYGPGGQQIAGQRAQALAKV